VSLGAGLGFVVNRKLPFLTGNRSPFLHHETSHVAGLVIRQNERQEGPENTPYELEISLFVVSEIG